MKMDYRLLCYIASDYVCSPKLGRWIVMSDSFAIGGTKRSKHFFGYAFVKFAQFYETHHARTPATKLPHHAPATHGTSIHGSW